MIIELKKFGDKLISRPAGREAYLAMSAYLTKDVDNNELIEIDFDGVKVINPSWADEVITKIYNEYKNVRLLNADSPVIKATLKTLKDYSGVNI